MTILRQWLGTVEKSDLGRKVRWRQLRESVNCIRSANILHRHLAQATLYQIEQIRPFDLADVHQQDRQEMLNVLLHAVHHNICTAFWTMQCPVCDGLLNVERDVMVLDEVVCFSCKHPVPALEIQRAELLFRPHESMLRLRKLPKVCDDPTIIFTVNIAPKNCGTFRLINLMHDTFVDVPTETGSPIPIFDVHGKPRRIHLRLDALPKNINTPECSQIVIYNPKNYVQRIKWRFRRMKAARVGVGDVEGLELYQDAFLR
jgi:hypothetical protein